MSIVSFYRYICELLFPNNNPTTFGKEEQETFRTHFLKNLECFPNFPDVQFITDLSCENYERKVCVANLVFLPFQCDIDSSKFSFSYANSQIRFDENKRRLIRKILESLDDAHILVLEYNNDSYYINGIINKSDLDDLFSDYYFISIDGYLKWSAKCKNFGLFDYDKGIFKEFNQHSNEINSLINKVFPSSDSFLGINLDNFKEILEHISKQNHGTSFVIFNSSNDAENEANRLCDAERGFKAKNVLSYNKLLECISQFTKVDGGLIMDKNLNCYAYGCIYDGYIDSSFIGSLERGSRHNSTKLYVHSLNNNNSSTCFGVVFSDDGGMECFTG